MTELTVKAVLSTAHALGLARLDAQLLLLHCLGKVDTDRAWLLAHDGDVLTAHQTQTFASVCQRRVAGEPVAYIVGYKEFFGLKLDVDNRVLTPRPDTETLVQWALDVLKGTSKSDVLDLGAGSGAVAIAIALHSLGNVTATDNSPEALQVASANARRLTADVQCLQSNWFENVAGHYHLIASNPPYIADADPHLAALMHEPLRALTAGADGLKDIRIIVQQAPHYLHTDGWLILEHGYDQATGIRQLLIERGFVSVQSRKDLAGIERCTGGQWVK